MDKLDDLNPHVLDPDTDDVMDIEVLRSIMEEFHAQGILDVVGVRDGLPVYTLTEYGRAIVEQVPYAIDDVLKQPQFH